MSEPTGAVVITLKDVYTELHNVNRETSAAVSALNANLAKILGHLETIDQRHHADERIHADFEGRLRMLERWRYALPASMALALASALSTLGQFLTRR